MCNEGKMVLPFKHLNLLHLLHSLNLQHLLNPLNLLHPLNP